MSKILDELTYQKECLFERHPDLRRLKVIPLCQTGMTFKEISDFIEESWRDYYGDAARIFYTPELIEWLLRDFENDRNSLAVFDRDASEILGLVLSLDRKLCTPDHEGFMIVLRTGLSISPGYTSGGLGTLLLIENLIKLCSSGYDLCIDWYDIREHQKAIARKISRDFPSNKSAEISVSGKTLDLDAAQKYQTLSPFERGVMKLNLIANPIKHEPDMPYVTQLIPDIAEVVGFYDRCTSKRPLRRYFTEEELLRQLTYHKDGFVFLLKDPGGIRALVNGYNNRINNIHAVAYLDMVLFDSHLSFSKKRGFMRHVESKIYIDHGDFAIVLFSSGVNENMLKYGYVPFEKQAVAVFPLKESIAIEPDALKGIFLDVK